VTTRVCFLVEDGRRLGRPIIGVSTGHVGIPEVRLPSSGAHVLDGFVSGFHGNISVRVSGELTWRLIQA
jgi:hypothetical protein